MPKLLVPNDLLCPITKQLFQEPVVVKDGQTYEKTAIQQWFQEGHDTSPLTNTVLNDLTIVPNHLVKRLVIDFHHKHISDDKFIKAFTENDLKALNECVFLESQLSLIDVSQLVNPKKLPLMQWIVQQDEDVVNLSWIEQAIRVDDGLPVVQYLYSVKPALFPLVKLHYVRSLSVATFLYQIGCRLSKCVCLMPHADETPLHTLNFYGTPLDVALYWIDQKETPLFHPDIEGNLPLFTWVKDSPGLYTNQSFETIFTRMVSRANDTPKLVGWRNRDSFSLLEYAISCASVRGVRLVLKHFPELILKPLLNKGKSNLTHLLVDRLVYKKCSVMESKVCLEVMNLIDPGVVRKMINANDAEGNQPITLLVKHMLDVGSSAGAKILVSAMIEKGASVLAFVPLLDNVVFDRYADSVGSMFEMIIDRLLLKTKELKECTKELKQLKRYHVQEKEDDTKEIEPRKEKKLKTDK